MGVKRTALAFEKDFARIPNAWMRDQRLSRKARGLLAEIMTHSVGWHVSVKGLIKTGPEGRDAIKSALVELKDAGYLLASQTRGDGGKWNEVEYELNDPSPRTDYPSADGLSGNGSSASGQSDPKKTISIEDHPQELLSAVADEPEDRVSILWDLWPSSRRSTRKVVARSLSTALKAAPWSVIHAAAVTHSHVWRSWPAVDQRFVPLLSTWLNQERWSGAPPSPRSNTQTFARQRQENSLAIFEHYKNQEENHAEVRNGEAAGVQALDRGW